MRLPAVRALLCTALLLGGITSGAAIAGTVDPIDTITSAVSTVVGQTTVVSDLAGTATGATAGTSAATSSGSLAQVTSSLTGSGTQSSSDGGSSAQPKRRASASNPGSPRTRFDRLPRRYELLLERIELGHHVRANLARLKALLASASPEFRARLLRLIRAEISRLERGGLTPSERSAVRRLQFLIEVIGAPTAGGATAAQSFRTARVAAGEVLSATAGGRSASEAVAAQHEPPSGGGIPSGDSSPHFLPYIAPGRDWWAILGVVASFLGACLLFTLLLGGRRHGPA
ncbi:MAG TPA: hypothetical protein VGJ49_01915 [Gaiellaceae bacterium]